MKVVTLVRGDQSEGSINGFLGVRGGGVGWRWVMVGGGC